MSSQWKNSPANALKVSASAAARLFWVASEKTTPNPNVSSRRLRSRIVISELGSAFFIRIPKYNAAGPPPIATILT